MRVARWDQNRRVARALETGDPLTHILFVAVSPTFNLVKTPIQTGQFNRISHKPIASPLRTIVKILAAATGSETFQQRPR